MGYVADIGKILKSMDWKIEDKNALVALWTRISIRGPIATRGKIFFAILMSEADLPDSFMAEMADPWVPQADANARQLFDWALGKGINPKAPQYTTLASLILPTLPKLGVDDAYFCVALIEKYKLIVGREASKSFATRYQVPMVGGKNASYDPSVEDYGPDMSWEGESTEGDLKLQGLFKEPPAELDVGYLMRAINCAAGICRIEIAGKALGSGFLISPNLVMTNFHVFGEDLKMLVGALPKTKLRFGAFTNKDATEDEGQLVGIEAQPVISSVTAAHDYVVLRALPDIGSCKGLVPFTLQPKTLERGEAINILHHPNGGSMKFSFATNAVVNVQDDGKIQYITRTSGGSSGSPCLNDSFNVVAIHHAARAKAWGVVGEGIASAKFADDVGKII